MITFLLMIFISMTQICSEDVQADVMGNCRLTQAGTEYLGSQHHTKSGLQCDSWNMALILSNDQVASKIVEHNFPDGSLRDARNYCRNPTSSPDGPWCLTMNRTLEACDIPLCVYRDCRHSGPGAEYRGDLRKSAAMNPCQPWEGPLAKNLLGESTCANPTLHPAGPWCQTLADGEIRDELCDVPLCDFPMSGRVSLSHKYSLFTATDKREAKFSVKLWNPVIESSMKIGPKIIFSALPSLEGNTGFELELGLINRKGGLTLRRIPFPRKPIKEKDISSWKPARSVDAGASGLMWTRLWVAWDRMHIYAGEGEDMKNYRVFLPLENQPLNFYSTAGPAAMWNFTLSCEVLWTRDLEFSQFWLLHPSEMGFHLDFHIRAFHSVELALSVGPHLSTVAVKIVLQRDGKSIIQLVREQVLGDILSYDDFETIFVDVWKWEQFSITLFGDLVYLTWKKSPTLSVTLLKAQHPSIRAIRWFSIGSDKTLAQWTLDCHPPANDTLSEDAMPPECSVTATGVHYKGHQRAAASGRPCLPWTHEVVPPTLQDEGLYPDTSLLDASNFCRNPDKSEMGPWCYTSAPTFTRESCNIRMCRYRYCRMAGTGNDYMGTQNITISGRKCQEWEKFEKELKGFTSNFPENSVIQASNYCRNPTRSVAGSWCYTGTADEPMKRDVCYIKNCEKEDACTLVTVHSAQTSFIYVLPKWRVSGMRFWLKEWDPDKPDGVKFTIKPLNDKDHYLLVIGGDHNEYVELYKNELRVMRKAMSHVIPIGKWGGFWLRLDTGLLELGFEDVEEPFFSWIDQHPTFTPMLLGVGSIYEHMIGIHFPCDECLLQRFEGPGDVQKTPTLMENVYPVHLWRPGGFEEAQRLGSSQLELYVRGFGAISLSLLQFPLESNLSVFLNRDALSFAPSWKPMTFHPILRSSRQDSGVKQFIDRLSWKKYIISFNESMIKVSYRMDNGSFNDYSMTSTRKLVYHYVIVRGYGDDKDTGLDWTINCPPSDVSPPARDGGWSAWSEWRCSVDCGGGVGYRRRTCTNPEPNILGSYCEGDSAVRGRCNESPCGTASRESIRATKLYLTSRHFSYELRSGQNLSHTCQPPALHSLLRELENASVTWMRNGLPLLPEQRNTTLLLPSTDTNSSGVYALTVRGSSEQQHTVCLLSVAVLTGVKLREGERLELQSHALPLRGLVTNMTLHWVLNNHTWRSFRMTSFRSLEVLRIEGVDKKQHAGEWRCVITQGQLQLSWTTAWYDVSVGPSRSVSTLLLEDPLFSRLLAPLAGLVGEAVVLPTAIALTALLLYLLLLLARFLLSVRSRQL